MQLKLLLLEDQEPDAAIVLRVLQRSGMKYEALRVSNREEFIEALHNDSYHAILADNYLPQFDAYGALEIMRELKVTTPLILVTGTASEEFAVRMMKAGIADYILKDRLQRLPTAIMAAIEKHALEEEHTRHINMLIQNEALLKASEQLAHLGSWETDLQTGITIWSDESYRILGYKPAEITPSQDIFLKVVHPEDLPSVKKTINEAISNRDARRFDCRIITRDNKLKYLECNINAACDQLTKAIRINGFSIDVTHRKRAEEQLRISEANLHTIFKNTETGYTLLDAALNVVSFNQPMYQFSLEQMSMPLEIGKPAIPFFKPERHDTVAKILNDAQKGITSHYEVCYPQTNGSDKWFDINCHPAKDDEEQVIGIVLSQADITRKKTLELQEKLMKNDLILRNSVLEQFAYVVSHNLRGPMATILGIADLMIDDNITNEDDRQFFMKGIAKSVQKLDSVILDLNSILQFRGSDTEQKQMVNFSEVVHEITAAIKAPADGAALSVNTNFSAVGRMFTLKSYINSIFYNLISNSIKFKQPGITAILDISSQLVGNTILLTFKDNGMGMNLSKIGDQIFGLFKRFHPNAAEGKGLGLFMVKTQVGILGGDISITSETDKGTEIQIALHISNNSGTGKS